MPILTCLTSSSLQPASERPLSASRFHVAKNGNNSDNRRVATSFFDPLWVDISVYASDALRVMHWSHSQAEGCIPIQLGCSVPAMQSDPRTKW